MAVTITSYGLIKLVLGYMKQVEVFRQVLTILLLIVMVILATLDKSLALA